MGKCKTVTFQLRPCPCCGGTDLDVGVMSVCSYGVKCRGCRLRMEKHVPDEAPKGVWKKGEAFEDNLIRLHEWLLAGAVVAWNARFKGDDEAFGVQANVLS